MIPFYNEGVSIQRTLESLGAQELGGLRAELLLIDGRSTDESADLARVFAAVAPAGLSVRVLSNEARVTPAAFNLGIREATSSIIGFGGAHTLYPPHYLREAHRLLTEGKGDVVGGGFTDYLPAGPGALNLAMSYLYRSPFGAGVAAYHRRTTPGLVDTVYGGFYRREVFERVGGFNEILARNQDNELNARVRAAGFHIYFDPRLSTAYGHKPGLGAFLLRGFRFGEYHPQTWTVNPRAFQIRHAVPLGLVVYLVILLAVLVAEEGRMWMFLPLTLYTSLLLGAAVVLWVREQRLAAFLTIPLFSAFHMSYGLGTLVGLARQVRRRGR